MYRLGSIWDRLRMIYTSGLQTGVRVPLEVREASHGGTPALFEVRQLYM